MNKKNLYFLRFGYYPGNISKIINPTNYDHKQPFDLKELIDLFKKEIADCCKDKRIRIPLSGGFDSRFLLALCIDLFSKDKKFSRTIYEKFRRAVISGRLLKIKGRVQSENSVIHIIAEHIEDISYMLDDLPKINI